MLELDSTKITALVGSLLDKPDGSASIRAKLAAFAEAEGLPI